MNLSLQNPHSGAVPQNDQGLTGLVLFPKGLNVLLSLNKQNILIYNFNLCKILNCKYMLSMNIGNLNILYLSYYDLVKKSKWPNKKNTVE